MIETRGAVLLEAEDIPTGTEVTDLTPIHDSKRARLRSLAV